MKVNTTCVLFWSMCIPFGLNGETHDVSTDVLARFRREAPRGWLRLEKWNRNLEIQGVIQEDQGTRHIRTNLLHYATRAGSHFTCEEGMDENGAPKGNQGIFAGNGRYAFWIQRKKPTHMFQLLLLQTGSGNQRWIEKEISTRYYFATSAHSHFAEKPFAATLEDPTFKWTRAESVTVDARNLVKVHYSCTRTFASISEPVAFEGYYIFWPANYWVAVEASSLTLMSKLRRGLPRRTLVRMSYFEEPLNEIRPMKEYKEYVRWDDNDKMEAADSFRIVFIVNSVHAPKIDESAFTLSGHGMAEPMGMANNTRHSWYLWAGIGTVLALLFAFLALQRKWDRKRGQQ